MQMPGEPDASGVRLGAHLPRQLCWVYLLFLFHKGDAMGRFVCDFFFQTIEVAAFQPKLIFHHVLLVSHSKNQPGTFLMI